MKKAMILLSLLLVFSLALSPVCYAAGDNYDTLTNWDIKIAVPDGATAVLKGDAYYIYAQRSGSIPYVMLMTYRYDSETKFIPDFTKYMQTQYKDLTITSEAEQKTIGDKLCYEIDYAYTVSGYTVNDRRIVITVDERTYMFASKEIEELGMTVGTMLADVVADCEFLSDGALSAPADEPIAEDVLSQAYLYCQEDGMPKYWLDFSGHLADNPVLHCYFRSGEPTYYESWFILDLDTADVGGDEIEFYDVYNERGIAVSDWFDSVVLTRDGLELTLEIERDESTLAGGADDNILSGSYVMEPVGLGVIYEYYLDDGQLKYWLEPYEGDIELHCMFRSSDPEYYEEVFLLDLDTAEKDGDYVVKIHAVERESGEDVSHWFRSLTLSEVQGAYIMTVKRDESTLAGGSEDNILSGSYLLEPRVYLTALAEGPYTPEELGVFAQRYYLAKTGFYPPVADVEDNGDGTWTVHLYEVVSLDGAEHTATSAWYTVDAYGVGFDVITEAEVDLIP